MDPTRPKRRKRSKVLLLACGALAVALLAAGGIVWKSDLLSDNGEPMTFGRPPGSYGHPDPRTTAPDRPGVSMPKGPSARFVRASRLSDGTEIGRTTLAGAKSGFTGDVWVWVPREYSDPRYEKSAFPVLISLPGGRGYPKNYWMGTGLGLQKAVTDGVRNGTSLPFILVMPVLNPDKKFYYDGSDIPGQPRMGTWMAEDVPDFVKANFRTFRSRDGWAFMGSSSGGFVALKQVVKYPGRFKAVIASGPETAPDSPLWHGHREAMDADNPEKLAQRLIDAKGPDVYVNFQIGTRESGRAKLERFVRLYGRGPVHTRLQVIEDGEHNGKSYVRGMREGSLEWISKVLLAPTPDPAPAPERDAAPDV